ncbi:MAG: strawberry notch family protein [Prevotella sp.]|nr:strawberry notch family protein [Prevotella sp.]
MAQDKREQLYHNLINSGKVTDQQIGSLDEFKAAIKDENTSRQFHQNLISSGVFSDQEIGSEDDFYNAISSDFAAPQPQAKPNIPTNNPMATIESMDATARTMASNLNVEKPKPQAQTQPQTKPAEAAQPQQSGGYKPTWQEEMAMNMTIGNAKGAIQNATKGIDKFDEGVKNMATTGIGEAGAGRNKNLRVKKSFNAETGSWEDKYVTTTGQEYSDVNQADEAQNFNDQMVDNERFKSTMLDLGIDISGERSIEEQIEDTKKEMQELSKKEKEAYAKASQKYSTPIGGTTIGGVVVDGSYMAQNDKSIKEIRAARSLAAQRLTALEAERDNKGFGGGVWDVVSSESSMTFGLSDLNTSSAMLGLKKKMDEAKAKGVKPEFTDSEKSLMKSYLLNQEAQQLNNNRSWWYGAGQGFGQSLVFMKDFALTGGGFANLYKAGVNMGAKAGTKMVASELTKALTKNLGTKSAALVNKSMMVGSKVVGGAIGAEIGGTISANTIQAASTMAGIADRYSGELTVNKQGDINFEGGTNALKAAFFEELNRSGENASELVGPGIDSVFGKVAAKWAKTAIGKNITNFVTKFTDNKVWKAGEKTLNFLGVQSVFGEGFEEEYGMARTAILNAVTGDEYDPNAESITDLHTQLDTWAKTGLTSGILRAPQIMASGYQQAHYYGLKYNLNTTDKGMRDTFDDVERYRAIKDMLDNAENKDFANTLNNAISHAGLSAEEKKAVVMYASDLIALRGFNIGNAVAAANGVYNTPRVDSYRITGNTIEELDEKGNVLSTHEYNNRDEMKAAHYKMLNDRLQKDMMSDKYILSVRPGNQYNMILQEFCGETGAQPEEVENAMEKDPMKRTDEEQKMILAFSKKMHEAAFDNSELHEEQSAQDGSSVADAEAIDYDSSDGTDGMEIKTGFEGAKVSRDKLFERNETLAQEVMQREQQDLSHQEIISALDWATDEERAILIDYYNQKARYESYMNRKSDKLAEAAANTRERNTFKGTINGQKKDINIMAVTDGENSYNLVSGNIQTDNDGNVISSDSGLILAVDANGDIVQLGTDSHLVVSETPIRLDQFQLAELERLQNEESAKLGAMDEEQPIIESEQPSGVEVEGAPTTDAAPTEEVVADDADVEQTTAMSRIPVGEDGQPQYEQASNEDTYNALVEQAGEENVPALVQSMINESEANLANLQKTQEKQQKGELKGKTLQEKIAEMQETKNAIEAEQGRLQYWQNVLNVPATRQVEAPAQPVQPTPPTEPIDENVPEYRYDTPEAARGRGYKVVEGQRIDRQEEKPVPQGMEVEVQYSTKDKVKGHLTVSELGDVQGSHLTNGQTNDKHFIPEAQPKAEFGADRQAAAQANASEANFRPELMLTFNGTQSAYSGSATQTNRRGEVIQGNGRRNLAEYIYAPGNEAVAKKYKEFLMAHAAELGTTAESIAQMEKPFAHIVLDVNDAEAIRLGQFTAADLETGGRKIPEVTPTVTKLGDNYTSFANIMLRHDDPDATLSERVEANVEEAVRWLNKGGYISDTEAKSLLEDKEAARQFAKDMLTDIIFNGANPDLRTMFYELPKNIQGAIVSSVGRELSVTGEASILKDLQESIQAFHELSTSSPQFAGVKGKNFEERYAAARAAANDWLRQINLDGSKNIGKYSNFAIELAMMYASLKDQKTLSNYLRQYYDLVNGSTRELGLFDAPATGEVLTKEQALKQIFGIDNGTEGNVPVADNPQSSQGGEETSPSTTESSEPRPTAEGTPHNTGGSEVNAPESGVEETPADKPQSEREKIISEHPLTVEDINSSNAGDAQKVLAKGYLDISNPYTTEMAKAAYLFIYNMKVATTSQVEQPQSETEKPITPTNETPKVEKPNVAETGTPSSTTAEIQPAGPTTNISPTQAAAQARLQAALTKLKKLAKNDKNSQTDAYSVDNLTPEQIAVMFEVVDAGAELGYTILDNTESKDGWVNQMRDFIGEQLKEATGYTDAEVRELIEDMWNYPYKVEGVMKTVGEWAAEKGINVNENNNGEQETGNMDDGVGDTGGVALGNTHERGTEPPVPGTGEGGTKQEETGGTSGVVEVPAGRGQNNGNGGRKHTKSEQGNMGLGLFDSPENQDQPGGRSQSGSMPTNNGGGLGANESGESGRATEVSSNGNSSGGGSLENSPKPQLVDISKEKTDYEASSSSEKKYAIGSVIPSGIVDSIRNAFKRLKEKFFQKSDTADFVREELGYKTKEEMFSAFESGKTTGLASEQVDAVALAIGKMKEGKSFIVGDMTGVGKGRTAAALIHWGIKHGKKVIFVTEKSKLFSDMYRDMSDIGQDYMPFITNKDAEADITDEDGKKVISRPKPSVQNALYDTAEDKLPKNEKGRQYDFVMTTYTQISGKDEEGSVKASQKRKDWLRLYAKDAILILDESHNASGESNTGRFFRELVQESAGTTFLSATYAKRPENMLLYAVKSSMSALNMPLNEMLQAIKEYGVSMQEIMAEALFKSGEMIRRERDMSGVKTTWTEPREIYSEEEYEKCRTTSDKTMSLVQDIIDFQHDYVDPLVKKQQEQYELQNQAAAKTGGVLTFVTNTSYKSQVSNVTNLMVFAMKAKKAAEMAIEQIKQGGKPIIAVHNTMESYVKELGDEIDTINFKPIFDKGVKFSLKYVITQKQLDENNRLKTINRVEFDAEDELDSAGAIALANLRSRIEEYIADNDKVELSLSPIDLIRHMMADAGYSCGEITGRKYQLERNQSGGYTKMPYKAKGKDVMRRFNGGSAKSPLPKEEQFDALIINDAGATGISGHASKNFGNQNPRKMIILQPNADVTKEVQMRGRIDRTGQVHRGEYFYVSSPIPAEQKLMMTLKKKLSSLDAQSTGTKDVSSNKVDAIDMDNKYGDEVCKNYLLEHLNDINSLLDKDTGLKRNDKTGEWEGHTGLLYDVLINIQRLPCAIQERVINELSQRYIDHIDYLNQNGINDLESTTMNLEATTIDKATFISGKDNESENEFAHDSSIERVEVNVLKKPMRSSDIKKKMKELDALDEDGLPKGGLTQQTDEKVAEAIEKKINERQERYNEQETKLEEKLRSEHPKKDEQTEEEWETMIQNWPSLVEMRRSHTADINTYKGELGDQQNTVYHAAMYLKPGRPYLVPLTDDISSDAALMYGRFLGFQTKNGDPRQVKAVFAVKDSRSMISIPVVNNSKTIQKIIDERGDLEIIALERTDFGEELPMGSRAKKWDEWWDKMIPKNTNRQIRFMITGNVLQACGSLGKYKGQIVTFTRKNKETGEITVERGMLLAENFDPENFKVRKAVEKKDVWEHYDEVKDEQSGVSCHREGSHMAIVFTKRKGQKLSEHPAMKDDVLKGLIMDGDLRPSKKDIACVVKEENVEKVLDHLHKEYGYSKEELFVMPDSTEKPDAIVRTNRPYQEIIEEFKDKYGSSKYSVSLKIKQMLKRYKMDINNDSLKEEIKEAVMLRQAYLRQEQAGKESNRLAWQVLIEDQYIEKLTASEDKDARERHMQIREAILEELEYRGFKGNAYHYQQGKLTLDDVKAMFDKMNDATTEEGKAKKVLFDKIMAKVGNLPMEIFMNEKLSNDIGGQAGGKVVEYNWKYMNADYIADQAKADTILHELIHTVTAYADRCVEEGYEHLLDSEMIDAINELHNIFNVIENNPIFEHDGIPAYGLTNVREMLSEAGSNSEFRADLKKVGLWAKLKAGILMFFGIKQNQTMPGAKEVNVYDQIIERLDYLIENFNEAAWNEYYKGTRYGNYGYKKMDAQKIDTTDPMEAIEQAAESWTGSQNLLNDSQSNNNGSGNDITLQPEKSYTNRHGVYREGLSEELQRLEKESKKADAQSSGIKLQQRVAATRRRINIIRAELSRRQKVREDLRKKYNIDKKGNITLENLAMMFNDLNNDERTGKIFNKVLAVLKRLKVDFRFTDSLEGGVNGGANPLINITFYNWDAQTQNIENQDKARILLHEMIHNVTSQVLLYYSKPLLRPLLSYSQISAARKLNAIYKEVKKQDPKNDKGDSYYGNISIFEMLAELANPKYRTALDNIKYNNTSIWQQIKDAIKKMLNLGNKDTSSSTSENIEDALDEILESYNSPINRLKHRAMRDIFDVANRVFGNGEDTVDFVEKLDNNENTNVFMDALNKAADSWNEDRNKLNADIDAANEYSAKQVYQQRIDTAGTVTTEAYQDSMVSLKVAQNAIAHDKDIPDSQNAYMAENLSHGKIKNEQDLFKAFHKDAIVEVVSRIMKKTGMGWHEIDRYLFAKHGLERNREFFVRDFIEKRSKQNIGKEPLNEGEDALYESILNRIETDFEDGVIDEEKRKKLIAKAPMEARYRWLDYIEDGWKSTKKDSYKELTDGNITFGQYLWRLTSFINNEITDYIPEEHDYSGFTAMYGNEDGEYDEVSVIADVETSEDIIGSGVDVLWEKIGAANKYSLEKYRQAGMKTDKQIDDVESMFNWYVPMRGFKEKRGEDMYQYINSRDTRGVQKTGSLMKHAKGRFSEADSPLATIFAMGYKAIVDCNRNIVKQHLWRLCNANQDNDLIILREAWVEQDANGDWEAVYPQITDDMSVEEIREEIKRFDNDMRDKKSIGLALPIRNTEHFDYKPADQSKRSEHIVEVMVNGDKKTMIVVGNPRMAQAINGLTKFSIGDNWLSKANAAAKNWMSQASTTYNITFMARNMARDWTHFTAILSAREGARYAAEAASYYTKSLPKMVGLFKKYRNGTIDESNELERDFKEFMDNGGTTGFVQMNKVQDIQKDMKNTIAAMKRNKAIKTTDGIITAVFNAVEAWNEAIENNARFATYRTSRHYAGRTKQRSAYDAKEVTVNFNKKGAGNVTAGFKSEKGRVRLAAELAGHSSQLLGEGKMFFNATIQALATIFKGFKNNDGTLNWKNIAKFTSIYALPPFAGAIMAAAVNKALMGLAGDDDDAYANLPEWVRRKNMCIYMGWVPGIEEILTDKDSPAWLKKMFHGSFLTLPIGQEMAAFYGLGDMIAGWTINPDLIPVNQSVSNELTGFLNVFSPVDFETPISSKEGIGSTLPSLVGRVSTVGAPIVAVGENLSWMGTRIFMEDNFPHQQYVPEYKMVFNSTNKTFVAISKGLNDITGGDDVNRGYIQINPGTMQYITEQYLGGPGKFFANTLSIARDAKEMIKSDGEPDFNIRKVEVVKAFLQQGDDRTDYKRQQAKYKNYRDEAREREAHIKGYKKDMATNPYHSMKYHELTSGVDYARMKLIKSVDKNLKKLNDDAINAKSVSSRKEKRDAYNRLLKDVVERLDNMNE